MLPPILAGPGTFKRLGNEVEMILRCVQRTRAFPSLLRASLSSLKVPTKTVLETKKQIRGRVRGQFAFLLLSLCRNPSPLMKFCTLRMSAVKWRSLCHPCCHIIKSSAASRDRQGALKKKFNQLHGGGLDRAVQGAWKH